ncbi:MAG: hypothetical protein ACRD7E_23080, partial [Bryobacteraceae bacterium]
MPLDLVDKHDDAGRFLPREHSAKKALDLRFTLHLIFANGPSVPPNVTGRPFIEIFAVIITGA